MWKRGLWKSCGTLLVWGSYGNNLNRFGWILKNYRNALCLHRVDQLVKSAKKEMLFYLSELLIVVKRKTVRKWELITCRNFVNLRTEDFLVDQSCSKIYRMWKYYQNICNNVSSEYVLICRSSEGDAYSHLSWVLWDDAQ